MAKLKGGSYVAGLLTVEGACIAEEFSKPSGATLVTIRTASPPTVGIIPKVDASASNLVDSIILERDGVITVVGKMIVDGEVACRSRILAEKNKEVWHAGNVGPESSLVAGAAAKLTTARTITITGDASGSTTFDGSANKTITLSVIYASTAASCSGNAASATKLSTARTIGGVSFNGTANINLPGVNIAGNQNTSGNAATATKLATARKINGVLFDGSTDITVADSTKAPKAHASSATTYGVASEANYGHAKASPVAGSANGTASKGTTPTVFAQSNHVHPLQTSVSGNAGTATKLATARKINGVLFDGSTDITIATGTSVNYSKSTSEAYYNILWVSQAVGGLTQVYSTDTIRVFPGAGEIKATVFNATSLRSAKMDIKPFHRNALEIIRSTQICTYYYKTDENKEHLRTGFIADDTDAALATKNHDSMDIASSVGVLMKAIQELDAIVQKQAAEIEKLKQPFWKRWFL